MFNERVTWNSDINKIPNRNGINRLIVGSYQLKVSKSKRFVKNHELNNDIKRNTIILCIQKRSKLYLSEKLSES